MVLGRGILGALGEGMPQHFDLGHRADRARKHETLFRRSGPRLCLLPSSALRRRVRAMTTARPRPRAGRSSRQVLGLRKPPDASGADADINYSERSPLVVPPSAICLRQWRTRRAGRIGRRIRTSAIRSSEAKAKRRSIPDTARARLANPRLPEKALVHSDRAGSTKQNTRTLPANRCANSDRSAGRISRSIAEQPYGISDRNKGASGATADKPISARYASRREPIRKIAANRQKRTARGLVVLRAFAWRWPRAALAASSGSSVPANDRRVGLRLELVIMLKILPLVVACRHRRAGRKRHRRS